MKSLSNIFLEKLIRQWSETLKKVYLKYCFAGHISEFLSFLLSKLNLTERFCHSLIKCLEDFSIYGIYATIQVNLIAASDVQQASNKTP